MSDLFSIYEDSLNIVLKQITSITSSMKNLSKEKTENALNEAHNNLKEANRILKQMQLEVESEKNKSSTVLASKLRNYTSEVEVHRKKFMKLQEEYISKKSQDALMILESYDPKTNRKNQKKKLIENEEEFYEAPEENKKEKEKQIEMIDIKNGKEINTEGTDENYARDEIFDMGNNTSFRMKICQKRNRKKILIACGGIFVFVLIGIVLYLIVFNKNNTTK